ncbi:SusC/RagA family TonB-linked outer membrane protein [Cyclobacterium qasimii]|uniref:TonB-dependent receptor n=1 Tax=Cyclobacterium qasimii M12-11B TaxID=641524 RepID=S7VBP3_9BACT|nr:TonB-dependent receptor [Cyclobacterium qasimii]EPR66992.1 TonB-dependent receptor [Cyclobacterium qasimii M12-11B]
MLIFLFSPDIGYGNNISLKLADINENEWRAAITGTVVDVTGEPIPGVTVSVPGTGRGTATDLDGNYTINVDKGTTLVFSFIGFVSQRIQVIDQSIINITLLEDTSSLDEVVVVGYGTQKKENLTGSVSSVNFDDELQNRPLTNASQALSGQVPGVWISQNSGKPGDDGAQIRVRGWGTLNNSNPLILVDGVEASINEINPNDIESMTVLKDAASSAIYGSRAANGVVLITLKSGKFGEKTSINIGSYVGQQSLGRRYDIIENSAEYMGMWNQALANQGGSALFPESVINEFRNNNDPYVYPNTNFFDEVFRKAPITEHNISVNGGSEQTKFYVSMNYLNQDGIMLNSKSNRYGLTVNLETKLKEWLTIGGRLNGIKKSSEEPFNLGRMMYIFSNGGYPFTAPYTEDGRFGSVQAINSSGNTIVGNRNPLIETANGLSISENNFFKMNVFANIDFTDYLTLKTNLTSQYNSNLLDKHNNLVYGYTNTGVEGKNLDYLTILEASRNNIQSNYNTLFSTLNFNKTYNEIHDISAIAGIQVESTVIKDVYGRRSGPPKEGLIQIDAGTAGFQANGNMSELRMLSYFGRVNYALSDKYLFEMNLRADGSSRFKEDYRWGIFPAFSAGWRLGEEVFMKSQNLISDLKIRASWGKLGNQNINSYWPYLAVVSQTNALSYNFSGSFAPGAGITALVDESIGWETSVTTDLGVEFGLLNNRIFVEADYFRKTTSDIIVQLPIPSILGGVSAPFENVGEMTNNGFEFNINYSKLAKDRDEVGYNIGVNMTYIANQVTKFRENSPDQLYLIREGFSYRELYGYKATGIYQSDQEASEHMFANGYIPQAGELKYEDVNNDGRLGFEDKMALGNTIPKYTFGLTPSVNYKGFDLSTVVMGIAGANVYTQNAWTQPLGISGGTITEKWRDAWTVDNMSTTVPRISISDTWRSEASSYWVSDISFVKLRNIQLGYTFSSALTERLGLQKLYVYGNAQNVGSLVSKDYEGFDPERNTFDSGDNFYPLPKIISLGVNINL